jgi:hypothetical protein
MSKDNGIHIGLLEKNYISLKDLYVDSKKVDQRESWK